MIEAQRYVAEVQFSGALGASDVASTAAHGDYAPDSNNMIAATRQVGYASSNQSVPGSPYPSSQTFSPAASAPWGDRNQSPHSMDDFGVMGGSSTSMGPNNSRLGNGFGSGGGRFATFPVRDHPDAPPSLGFQNRENSLDFSSQVEQALRHSPTTTSMGNLNGASGYTGLPTVDESLPTYEPYSHETSSMVSSQQPSSVYRLAPTQSPNAQGNPWDEEVFDVPTPQNASNKHLMPVSDMKRKNDSDASGDEARLAYMSSREDFGQGAGGSHVRFGGTSNEMAEDMGRRRSEDAASGNIESPIDEQAPDGLGSDGYTPREEFEERKPYILYYPSYSETNEDAYFSAHTSTERRSYRYGSITSCSRTLTTFA